MTEKHDETLIRFVTLSRHPPYGHRSGIFKIAYDLSRERQLSANEQEELNQLLKWFQGNLAIPKRFASSRHPHAVETAISWIRASAHDHLARIRMLVTLLESAGIQIDELRTLRPGYVLYEDDHQVVALPFSDTPR